MENAYTKEKYKNEILNFIDKNDYDPVKIAKFTSRIFFSHQGEFDLYLRDKLLDIMTMEDGPEFEMSEKEFNDFLHNM